jgi:8-oxo-dGTP pyrophosphatase MutT (NUDIX family)
MIERSSGVIIFRNDKKKTKNGSGIKYLIIQYGYGHWEFVKGNIEKGEKSVDTAVREAKEEVGISDLKFVPKFKATEHFFYRKNGKLISKYVVFFLASTKKKRVKLSYEHKAYKWLNFDDVLKQLTFKESKALLKKANTFLRKSYK